MLPLTNYNCGPSMKLEVFQLREGFFLMKKAQQSLRRRKHAHEQNVGVLTICLDRLSQFGVIIDYSEKNQPQSQIFANGVPGLEGNNEKH